MTPSLAWPLALLAFAFLWYVAVYNSLVRARNRAAAAWSQIDVQLRRRHDLIPNLVETVKGYLQHERQTLEAVTRARREAMEEAGDVPRRAQAENSLSRSLRSLMAVMERYPDLKAVSAVRDLMEQLSSTENRIAFARQHYNDLAATLNTRIETFPNSLLARWGGFACREFFRMEDAPEARDPGTVAF